MSAVASSEQKKVAFDMNDMMLQATRLTRANRLIEATALIQRMLRGETDSEIASLGNKPSIIDADAETIDETQQTYLNPARFAQPHYFGVLRDSTYRVDWPSRHGLWEWMQQPVPVSTADIVPEGGKFTEAIYTNPAGSRAYKLSSPAAIRAKRFLWSSCCTAALRRLTISLPGRE